MSTVLLAAGFLLLGLVVGLALGVRLTSRRYQRQLELTNGDLQAVLDWAKR